jgi:hypothetical protein
VVLISLAIVLRFKLFAIGFLVVWKKIVVDDENIFVSPKKEVIDMHRCGKRSVEKMQVKPLLHFINVAAKKIFFVEIILVENGIFNKSSAKNLFPGMAVWKPVFRSGSLRQKVCSNYRLNRNNEMMRICLQAVFFLLVLKLNAQESTHTSPIYSTSDSVVSNISSKYTSNSFLHRFIMGKNYRKTWNTPVKFPVFYLSKSPFTIEKLGGGQQTKSLRLKDQQGRDWVLRTVDKTVEKAIPKITRNTLVEKVVQDMVSASFPYGHVIVGQLSKAAGIIAPEPKLYFVADDTALGPYRSIFAHTICDLEQREPTPDNSDTKSTETVLEKTRSESDHLVRQKEYLRTRLMDVLVGDWDRHDDQWRWGVIDSTNEKIYYAIPRDRDNAFFHSGGLLPFLAKLTFMPYISGFSKNSSNIIRLSKKAWPLDKMLLNELDADDWANVINTFQQHVSDSAIEGSVRVLPQKIYALNGEELITKLKSRRDGLLKNGMKYYSFLSKKVTIDGSDERDLFIVSGKGNQIKVAVYQARENSPHLKTYERVFDPSETKTIYLNGLKSDDRFLLQQTASSKIKLLINGNEGVDVYEVMGKVKAEIMDTMEDNLVIVDPPAPELKMAATNQ